MFRQGEAVTIEQGEEERDRKAEVMSGADFHIGEVLK